MEMDQSDRNSTTKGECFLNWPFPFFVLCMFVNPSPFLTYRRSLNDMSAFDPKGGKFHRKAGSKPAFGGKGGKGGKPSGGKPSGGKQRPGKENRNKARATRGK